MAVNTKWSLQSSGVPDVDPSTWGSIWTGVAAFKAPMRTTKAATAKTYQTASAGAAAGGIYNVLLHRGVSELIQAQTLNGPWSLVAKFYESVVDANGSAQLVVRVMSGDLSTVRGVAYAGHAVASNATVGAVGEEFGTGGSTRLLSVTGTQVVAQAGDRIVAEIGARLDPAVAATYTVGIQTGDDGTDFAFTSGLTVSTSDAWFGTDDTVLFVQPPGDLIIDRS